MSRRQNHSRALRNGLHWGLIALLLLVASPCSYGIDSLAGRLIRAAKTMPLGEGGDVRNFDWAAQDVGARPEVGLSLLHLSQALRKHKVTTEELMPYRRAEKIGEPSDMALEQARKMPDVVMKEVIPSRGAFGFDSRQIYTLCKELSRGEPVDQIVKLLTMNQEVRAEYLDLSAEGIANASAAGEWDADGERNWLLQWRSDLRDEKKHLRPGNKMAVAYFERRQSGFEKRMAALSSQQWR